MQSVSPTTSKSLQAKYGGLYAFAKDVAVSKLAEERTPQTLIKLTNKLERLVQKEIDSIHGQIAELGERSNGILPVCKLGCWHCCTHLVLATPAEIISLADHIRQTWTAEEIDALKERIKRHKAITEPVRNGTAEFPPRAACPLLKDGACSAWIHRPFICRGWNSVDVEMCIRKREHPEEQLHEKGLADQFAVSDYIRQGLSEALESSGANAELCELACGLEIALNDPDAADRYLVGEDVFATARQGIDRWS